ncbi:MAG: L28 family ribosomal protein [Patescibacteria group bacterium]
MTRCPTCGKKPMTANKRKLLRGHYNIVNRYRKYPNLQWAKVPDQSVPAGWRRMKICTDCIKTLQKKRCQITR